MLQLFFSDLKCMHEVCVLSTFSSTAAEPARPIKGPDKRLGPQLSSPIQTLTYCMLLWLLATAALKAKQMEDDRKDSINSDVCVCV